MSEKIDGLEIQDNPGASRYEAWFGNQFAVSQYILDGRTITFTHTEVPEGVEGQGIASELARFALEDARARGLTVIPFCPFIKGYIDRHPEYQPLVGGVARMA